MLPPLTWCCTRAELLQQVSRIGAGGRLAPTAGKTAQKLSRQGERSGRPAGPHRGRQSPFATTIAFPPRAVPAVQPFPLAAPFASSGSFAFPVTSLQRPQGYGSADRQPDGPGRFRGPRPLPWSYPAADLAAPWCACRLPPAAGRGPDGRLADHNGSIIARQLRLGHGRSSAPRGRASTAVARCGRSRAPWGPRHPLAYSRHSSGA